ncbi:kunitz-type protease inhibitor 2 [Mantella aurantiaca]
MAAWLRGLLLLLVPLALAEPQCEGYEVLEGFGLADVEAPAAFGVRVLEVVEGVESDAACWSQCCGRAMCDLAVLANQKCHLIRCNVTGFNMCNVTAQEGARSYRRLDAGAEPRQEDFCLPKGETGPCRAYFKRWLYDAETETCVEFTYGGCPVNLNNHAGEDECMEKCRGVKVTKAESNPIAERLVGETPEMCSGPSVTGNCRAAFPRWYFDSESQSCQKFTYGGCGGSKNNHLSEDECIGKCIVKKPEPSQVKAPKVGNFKEYCAAAPSTGSCRASFTRFYYDPSTMACKTFVYGGCKPNKNNYLTESDCLTMCEGRSEDDDDDSNVDHHVIHRPLTAVVLPILLAVMAASLFGIMVVFFVKMAKKNQRSSEFRAMWNPIDDKECLMNSAYTL